MLGIQSISASKAGVLVQLTTVIVPIIESVIEQKALSPRLWIASALAMVGVIIVSIDNPMTSLASLQNILAKGNIQSVMQSVFQSLQGTTGASIVGTGELLVCLSAVFYSFHVLLLGRYAKRVDSVQLARNIATTELLLSTVVVGGGILLGSGTSPLIPVFSNNYAEYLTALITKSTALALPILGLTCLWNGAITTAYTMWAQTFGQQAVSPTKANLVYTSQPVWAALFAYLLLHEVIPNSEVFGCAVLLAGVALSQTKDNNEDSEEGIEKA